MSTEQDLIAAQLAELQREYRAELPARLELIESAWRRFTTSHDAEVLSQLYEQVHRLSGSGATFGFSALSRAAGQLELELRTWQSNLDALDDDALARGERLLGTVRGNIGSQSDPAHHSHSTLGSVPAASRALLVHIIEDDVAQARQLELQLSSFGYEVEVFHSASERQQRSEGRHPDVLVIDMNLPEGKHAGAHLGAQLSQGWERPVPIVFQSHLSDFEARLAAVRAGAAAYLVKPVEINQMVETLDRLTARMGSSPYRILIVDDDCQLAEHYALVLRAAGMKVVVASKPREAIAALVDEAPELILLDLYMPECSGLELARVIRQQERFIGTPIVFLSTESNLERQFRALSLGADDFLTKPVDDGRLTASIAIRAERARRLNMHMNQDGLTGLLKHTSIKDVLSTELLRCQRSGDSLSLAMIDIDRFKAINDCHGHPAGDRVIKSLARLLKNRVRRSDIIGRYGGDEFMVIFPGCQSLDAAALLESVRQEFSRLGELNAEDGILTTMSAGVIGSREHRVGEELIELADAALYRAKQAGRNRVIIADED